MSYIKKIQGEFKKLNNLEISKSIKKNRLNFKFVGKNGLSREDFSIRGISDSKKYNKAIGEYSIINIPKPVELNNKDKIYYINYLVKTLAHFINLKENGKENVMIVGLGNGNILSDSLGEKVGEKIIATRHLDNELFKNLSKLSVIVPGVLGQTGIETADIINSICEISKPKYIIAIDALCASDICRLFTSIQITNSGIEPGSGIKNKRKSLTKDFLSCEVIAIGVPSMIYYQSILSESKPTNELKNLLLTDANLKPIIQNFAEIIAKAINKFFLDIYEL